jgi:hypothetical protein
VSSKTARATKRNPVSKKLKNQKTKKPKKKRKKKKRITLINSQNLNPMMYFFLLKVP